ncbi:MAG: hypothetical protein DMG89_06990 [Acidobacteria bacterium]|nr:MAG: hypothetical protein DMG89_06990 [Acidobacteriota bacterium]
MNSNLQLALWVAHPVLQLAVAAIMFRRKQHKVFPVFFSYVISQVLVFAIIFPLYKWADYSTYFYAYWTCAAISLAIGFKVIHEIFLDVFQPYHTLKDLGSVLFKWAALVMVLVAFVVAAGSTTTDQGPIVQAVSMVERCVRVIQCGLILFLLLFSGYLGVSWKQQSFGMALGFGGFAAVELAMSTLRAGGRVSLVNLNFAIMVAYNCAIVVWFAYSFSKSPAREKSAQLLIPTRWDRSLYDAQRPAGGDSLIPMFEGMVERAFSRTQSNGEPEEPVVATVETPTHSTVIRKLATITGLASLIGLSYLSKA